MDFFASNIKHLREKNGLKQAEIPIKLNINRTTWNNYEAGVSKPNVDGLITIAKYFGVTESDLLHRDLCTLGPTSLPQETPAAEYGAKSKPYRPADLSPAAVTRMPAVVTVDGQGQENIPLVPVRARAGYLAGYEDPEFIQTLPTYSLPGMSHGTYRMFEVHGHSMVPTFHDSDLIIARYVENFLEIRDNRVYVVVSKAEGVVVKRVINRVQTDGKLILNSDNQRHAGDYPPIVISPEDVAEIWYAVAYMSRQMREPGELFNRLIDVEARLTLLEDGVRKGGR